MTIGRLHYDGGGDWYANPSSLPNLLTAIRTRTSLRVAAEEKVVALSDDDLWNVPYIYMTGHGNVHWSDRDLATLRRYLQQGGFLHADDNYGMDASIRRELAPALSRTIRWSKFRSTIRSTTWSTTFPRAFPRSTCTTASRRRDSGSSSTAGSRSTTPTRSDLGDGWEDFEVHHDPPEKHEAALRMGVNLFAYAVGYGG